MIAIFYTESNLKMEYVMRQSREGQKIQNVERQEAYQGRKSNEMTSEEGEERNKEHTSQQKEYRTRKLDGLTAQEREEQRKRNADRQRAYRWRKSNLLEEARNQFAEQQKNQNVE